MFNNALNIPSIDRPAKIYHLDKFFRSPPGIGHIKEYLVHYCVEVVFCYLHTGPPRVKMDKEISPCLTVGEDTQCSYSILFGHKLG